MKFTLTLSVMLIVACKLNFLLAQSSPLQGKITYKQVIKLKEKISKINPDIASMVPEVVSGKTELNFDADRYAVSQQWDETEQKSPLSLHTVKQVNQKLLINLKHKTRQAIKIVSGRHYYTESTLHPETAIVYTNEIRKILGYTCQKAIITTEDHTKATVWYTTAIPYAYHPIGKAVELNGAILEYTSPTESITAVNINTSDFNPSEMDLNDNAQKVTDDEMIALLTKDAVRNKKKETGQSTAPTVKTIRL